MKQFKLASQKHSTRLYALVFTGLFLLPGCSGDGLKLLSQLEARGLKKDALAKREMCFDEFVNQEKFESCYKKELFSLIADECVNVRATEPISQEGCENFLYRIVMKPNSLFPENEDYEGFPEEYRSDNFHPIARQGGCKTSQTCREKCRAMFGSHEEKDVCYEYATASVVKMNTVFSILQQPSLPKLRDMITDQQALRSLRILLGIGGDTVINGFSTGTDAWDEGEKKIVLSWLAESMDITEIMIRFDSNFILFTNVVGGSDSADTVRNLNQGLGGNNTGDNFIDKLLEQENEAGLKWLHDYITGECDDDGEITNAEKKCIFAEYYCEFNLHNNNELKVFEYDFFTDILDNILEFQRKSSGAPSWWDEDTRSEDLDPDQWQNGVCDNLQT